MPVAASPYAPIPKTAINGQAMFAPKAPTKFMARLVEGRKIVGSFV
jgi:hypothetical protein